MKKITQGSYTNCDYIQMSQNDTRLFKNSHLLWRKIKFM